MEKIINIMLKTNRYYDDVLENSRVFFSRETVKQFEEEYVCGKASKELYQQYLSILEEDERKAVSILPYDITKKDDFKNYILFLDSHLEENYGFFLKDAVIYELLCKNEPIATIKNSKKKSLSELLKVYNVREIMALTRLFEDSEWMKTTFSFMSHLTKDDYEYRRVIYLFFDEQNFETTHHFSKIIWDDKICGSVFGMMTENYISKVPILRSASELIHFHYEFRLYKKYIEYLIYDNHIRRIAEFLRNEQQPCDIFEPHALSEAYAWKYASDKLLEMMPFLSNEWNKSKLKVFISEEGYILSNNIIDYIRALSSAKFPYVATVTSLLLRYELLTYQYAQSTCNKAIYRNLEKDIIQIDCLRNNIC